MPKKVLVHHIDDFLINRGNEFYVNALPHHIKNHHFIRHPHKHDFYLCVLFTQGNGLHHIDFKTYKVKPGALFFLHPGQMHHWELSADVNGFIFFHSRDFYDLYYRNRSVLDFPFFSAAQPPVVNVNANTVKQFTWIFSELLKENARNEYDKRARICSLIDLVYIEAERGHVPVEKTKNGNSGYLLKLRQLEMLIDQHYKTEKSASAYADMMNMTRKHLNRICMSCVGKTLSEMIGERVMLEAKRLLTYAGHSVGQIADELGFEDHAYFNRFFKKHAGKTPLEFGKHQ